MMTQETTSSERRIENSSLKLMGGSHQVGTIFIVYSLQFANRAIA
jgi:hypothetical protein